MPVHPNLRAMSHPWPSLFSTKLSFTPQLNPSMLNSIHTDGAVCDLWSHDHSCRQRLSFWRSAIPSLGTTLSQGQKLAALWSRCWHWLSQAQLLSPLPHGRTPSPSSELQTEGSPANETAHYCHSQSWHSAQCLDMTLQSFKGRQPRNGPKCSQRTWWYSWHFSLLAMEVDEKRKKMKELTLSDPRLSPRIQGHLEAVEGGSMISSCPGWEKSTRWAPHSTPQPPAFRLPGSTLDHGAVPARKGMDNLPNIHLKTLQPSIKDRQTDTEA